MIDARDGRAAAAFYRVVALACGVLVAAAPTGVLLDRFVPDDAFYYLQTARHFVATGVPTFDGLHVTSGVQPLWFLISTLIVWTTGGAGEAPLRVALAVQAVLGAATAGVLVRTAARAAGAQAAWIAGALWIALFQRQMVNGLETAAQCALFAILLALVVEHALVPGRPMTARRARQVGVVVALLCLARVDGIFFAATVGAWLAVTSMRGHDRTAWRSYAIPIVVIVGFGIGAGLALTGDVVPVSGAVKAFHSGVERDAVVQAGMPMAWAVVVNVLWPFLLPVPWVAGCLVAPALLFGLAARARPDQPLRSAWALWPLAAGLWLTWIFYGVVFFGDHSRTTWYYGPVAMLGCICAAWILRAWFVRVAVAATVIVVASALGWRVSTIVRDVTMVPSGWNYHLYQGARWASRHLPADATIWSANAGILGYFSDRRVINTDGLANSSAYLEEVLSRGPAARDAHARQWDYAIDAFTQETLQTLPERFPDGCIVPLEADWVLPPFADGTSMRKLAVYQMRGRGIVNCASVPGRAADPEVLPGGLALVQRHFR